MGIRLWISTPNFRLQFSSRCPGPDCHEWNWPIYFFLRLASVLVLIPVWSFCHWTKLLWSHKISANRAKSIFPRLGNNTKVFAVTCTQVLLCSCFVCSFCCSLSLRLCHLKRLDKTPRLYVNVMQNKRKLFLRCSWFIACSGTTRQLLQGNIRVKQLPKLTIHLTCGRTLCLRNTVTIDKSSIIPDTSDKGEMPQIVGINGSDTLQVASPRW